MSFFTIWRKPQPKQYCLRPRNLEAYHRALCWLTANDPLDIVDSVNEQFDIDVELIYREFSTVYSNNTDIHDFPGTYNPTGWGTRAVFAYGYQLGLASARKGAQA